MPEKLTPEQERLMHLRERQLSVRDPQEKSRKFNQMAAERERKRDDSESLGEMWTTIPSVWKWGLFGLLVGILLVIILPRYWISPWATPIAIIVAIVLLIMAISIGRAIDLRDAIKKQL
jgi:uncharacterized membrane protein YraQ (UPF0718 family)